MGNGGTIKVWKDNWFPNGHLKRPVSAKPERCSISRVKELMNQAREDGIRAWSGNRLVQLKSQ